MLLAYSTQVTEIHRSMRSTHRMIALGWVRGPATERLVTTPPAICCPETKLVRSVKVISVDSFFSFLPCKIYGDYALCNSRENSFVPKSEF